MALSAHKGEGEEREKKRQGCGGEHLDGWNDESCAATHFCNLEWIAILTSSSIAFAAER